MPMKVSKILAPIVAAVSFMAIAPAASAMPTPGVLAPSSQCAARQVVFLPGGANTIPNVPERLPHGSITAQMGAKLGTQQDTNIHFIGYQAFPFAASTYQESTNEGYRQASAAINRIQNKCPNSKISLVGYSEGADIAARIINDAGRQRGPLKKTQLSSAVLYANPYQGGNGAAQWPADMSGATGALGHLSGGFGELAPNVLEICHPNDVICNYPKEYRGLVSPLMKMDALHGQLPLVELVKESVQYQLDDYITITKGLISHNRYGSVDSQVGIDWINRH